MNVRSYYFTTYTYTTYYYILLLLLLILWSKKFWKLKNRNFLKTEKLLIIKLTCELVLLLAGGAHTQRSCKYAQQPICICICVDTRRAHFCRHYDWWRPAGSCLILLHDADICDMLRYDTRPRTWWRGRRCRGIRDSRSTSSTLRSLPVIQLGLTREDWVEAVLVSVFSMMRYGRKKAGNTNTTRDTGPRDTACLLGLTRETVRHPGLTIWCDALNPGVRVRGLTQLASYPAICTPPHPTPWPLQDIRWFMIRGLCTNQYHFWH